MGGITYKATVKVEIRKRYLKERRISIMNKLVTIGIVLVLGLSMAGCNKNSDDNVEETNIKPIANHSDQFIKVKYTEPIKQGTTKSFAELVYNESNNVSNDNIQETIIETDEFGNEIVTFVTEPQEDYVDTVPVIGSIELDSATLEGFVRYEGEIVPDLEIPGLSSSVASYIRWDCAGNDEEIMNIIYNVIVDIANEYGMGAREILSSESVKSTDDYQYEIYEFNSTDYIFKIALNTEDKTDVQYLVTER